jgi:hypothetical protein
MLMIALIAVGVNLSNFLILLSERLISSCFSITNKAVNRGGKRSRRYRYRDFAKFERSRRYRDRYRCQEKKSRRIRDRYLVFRDPPPAENESSIANR